MPRHIGTLAEKSLHAALKTLYARPGDSLESDLDGYVIDILRPAPDTSSANASWQCIEIQTGNLAKMKPKLTALLDRYPVHVIHPIAQERFIVRIDSDGVIRSRRKSPLHGTVFHLFPELVSFPSLLRHPNLSLEVLLIREEQIWLDDGKGSWRRKRWSIHDRCLLEVVQSISLGTPADFLGLLPAALPPEFDCKELASAIHQPRYIAQKMAYCLREMEVLKVTGKRGNALVYQIAATI
jgi:hypothetical protein